MFEFTEEQLMIKESARELAQNILLPGVIQRDELQEFPKEQVRKMGQLGFMGMMVSNEYGGAGLDTISYVLALEEIAKIDASSAVIMSVNNSLICWGIQAYGSSEQKEKYLPKLASGEIHGAFCLSEPGSGSDATAQKTSAVKKGNHYVINGTKNWITNGNSASVYLVIAQSDPSQKHKGINAFIVDKSSPGIEIGPKENKMGIRASDTHSVMFNDVEVPDENRIGAEGFGFTFAMKCLEGGRIGIAAQALGIAAGAYELSQKYANQRSSFGKKIINHQAIGFKLVDMKVAIEATRMLCLKAAKLKDQNQDYTVASAEAKLFASKTAMDTCVEAVQIHGGYGYVKEYHVERLMRDAKITQIYEGTSEIQKLVILRSLVDR